MIRHLVKLAAVLAIGSAPTVGIVVAIQDAAQASTSHHSAYCQTVYVKARTVRVDGHYTKKLHRWVPPTITHYSVYHYTRCYSAN